ncbi:hypothetical protein MHPYR_440045 [uncultured Mycobacterium sp.]|uniref:Uncharacterized protein n=1 Tax=uncultured Mycobacterium sp. TaxID=171292 RepID=A0A1Y5PFX1_9MYCO|nr:hypothetical protein MHPYR_440045 [uncultured Mycobacterium sp.]
MVASSLSSWFPAACELTPWTEQLPPIQSYYLRSSIVEQMGDASSGARMRFLRSFRQRHRRCQL